MKRFVKISGVPGVLVSDPRSTLGNPRYLGKRRKPITWEEGLSADSDDPHYDNFSELFEDINQIVEIDKVVTKAIRDGYLKRIDRAVAKNHAHAERLMAEEVN